MSDHSYQNSSFDHHHDCDTHLDEQTRRLWIFFITLVVFVAGLTFNGVVVWVNWSRRGSGNGVLFCALNVGISDLLSMTVLPFFMFQEIMASMKWLWGQFLCRLTHFIKDTTYYSSSYFLAYLTVERYLAVKRTGPRPWGAVEQRRRAVLCGALWVLSAIPSVVDSFHLTFSWNDEPACFFMVESDLMWWLSPISRLFFQFLCPAVIIITCNLLTLRALRAFPEIQNQGRWSQPWLLHLYSVVFVICWMPFHVMVLISLLHFDLELFNCREADRFNFFIYIIMTFSLLHCVANPILYNFLSRGFRDNLMADIARQLPKEAVVGVVAEHHGSNVELGEERDKGSNDKNAREVNDSSTSQSDLEP